MAKNRLNPPNTQGSIYMPVIAGTVSGDPVCTGMIVGVAQTDRDASGFATVDTRGDYELTVTGALATYGLPVFINPATKALTVAAGTGLVVFGVSAGTKGAGAGPVKVRVGFPTTSTAIVGP